MTDVILRTDATPVYGFLSLINSLQSQGEGAPAAEAPAGRRILDCGAGGPLPPLTLFHQQGYDSWGIDLSDEQLQKARGFCQEQAIPLHLRKGDMRCLPFRAGTFDYVFEHQSMCHLSKEDTIRSIAEMFRVLRKGGLCFLGVFSMDCWPKSLFGEETEPGEFWAAIRRGQPILHSMFSDEEAAQLVAGWEIRLHEKLVRSLREAAGETTVEDWMDLQSEARTVYTREAWQARYGQRALAFQSVYTYYTLRKPL